MATPDTIDEQTSPDTVASLLKQAKEMSRFIQQTGQSQQERPVEKAEPSQPQDPAKQKAWAQKQVSGAPSAEGGPSPSKWEQAQQASNYSEDPRERAKQKKEAEADIKRDYGTSSAAARHGNAGNGLGRGKNLAGKAAGQALGAVAQAVPFGGLLIYGLAILNDFPDFATPFLDFFTGGMSIIVDFLFDAVVFLGFRYFLRSYLNIPGLKLILYGCTLAELLPGFIFSIDIFPFWTLCAYLALQKIKEQEQNVPASASAQTPSWVATAEAEAAA
ncbi:MAG: hypothetical protein A2445_00045 [Candidatus Jacksonbacteria bacterium RIFOXYC2_FULL_44_29]|nr:MAG: hypothetical protein UW45_C0064G0011 [Parcubacteria group bacterium GW2011_GWC2_44_22]OGY77614.1 MAG: hypothetical protein A2295_01545 [Candidatus Jacksonbacteria bacterium RIFOXYB2_FULL_44_15]OGY80236.1 MAG: hypothetical protein A2445_00045 [Candidatus Jacksonbacteria bacterium RIFOXYC2_FULL_44_29]OGY82150.1 MAG: hypothetical protein A2550_02980 [Candidatus Jacksonbacteria bacterium RIFOXYD2_FULL_43_21]HBH46769.1 hypothetical protein [Candidatus Jacksonbacteria bacterium]